MAVKLVLWWSECGGGLQVKVVALHAKLLLILVLLLSNICPACHMGLGFVSHPLFLLHPLMVSARVAPSL